MACSAGLPVLALLLTGMSFIVGIRFVIWFGTMWRGQLTFETPMLFSIGFMVVFLLGGLTGVILASPPLDFAVSDTYFLVAHFHYVLFGTVVFTMFGAFYFWWPKWTSKKLNETLGKWHFWSVFIGFNMTFLVQHWFGVMGMPRRVANYPFLPHLAVTLNDISSIGGAPQCVDIHLPLRDLRDLEERPAGHRHDPWGIRQLAGMDHLLPRPSTTSPPSPGCAPNAPRSACTTPTSDPDGRPPGPPREPATVSGADREARSAGDVARDWLDGGDAGVGDQRARR